MVLYVLNQTLFKCIEAACMSWIVKPQLFTGSPQIAEFYQIIEMLTLSNIEAS